MSHASCVSNFRIRALHFQPPLTSTSIPVYPAAFNSLLSAHHHSPRRLVQLHALAVTAVLASHHLVASHLLYSYSLHRALLRVSHLLFHRLPPPLPDSRCWSLLSSALSRAHLHEDSLRVFRASLRSDAPPDRFSLPLALRSSRLLSSLPAGAQLHALAVKAGLAHDSFVVAALVNVYARCGALEDARWLFDGMERRDMVTWTAMISGYASEGGDAAEALGLFDRMRREGFALDGMTMVAVITACARLGSMGRAREVEGYVAATMGVSVNVFLGTAMVEMYARCGSVEKAREVFDRMRERNVVTWSTMISAYGMHGRGNEALEVFEEMVRSGVQPSQITLLVILYACSHAGLVDEGERLFNSMERDYSIKPDIKHYTCMIDLLGRAGRLDEALALLESTELERDEGFWGALLGACRIHGNIGLAEKAVKSLLELRPRHAGYYVLLSNIYAKAGQWDDVARMRDLMRNSQVTKTPGWTWIEIGDKMHQFMVGNKSHPRSKEIYAMLNALKEKLELAGYIPDTDFVLHDVDEELKPGLLYSHSEKLAIAFGLIVTPENSTLRITKNLRVCGDCHRFTKLVSDIMEREIIVRDRSRFHHFKEGSCSCGDYW